MTGAVGVLPTTLLGFTGAVALTGTGAFAGALGAAAAGDLTGTVAFGVCLGETGGVVSFFDTVPLFGAVVADLGEIAGGLVCGAMRPFWVAVFAPLRGDFEVEARFGATGVVALVGGLAFLEEAEAVLRAFVGGVLWAALAVE